MRSYAMRVAVPVLATSHLLTFAVTRQVSALNPALRIPPPLWASVKNDTADNLLLKDRKRKTI